MTMRSEQEGVSLLETREDIPPLYGCSTMLVLILVNPKVQIEGGSLKLVSVTCSLKLQIGQTSNYVTRKGNSKCNLLNNAHFYESLKCSLLTTVNTRKK